MFFAPKFCRKEPKHIVFSCHSTSDRSSQQDEVWTLKIKACMILLLLNLSVVVLACINQ